MFMGIAFIVGFILGWIVNEKIESASKVMPWRRFKK
jgi:uncharacterized membrane protein YciS (DUF1049 family)